MSIFLFKVIFGFIPALGFCVLFHTPKRMIPAATFVGFASNLLFQLIVQYQGSRVLGCFCGACLVGLLAYILARQLKEATTVISLPGLMPLVPGLYIYYTMHYAISGSYSAAAAMCGTTFMMAGAVAGGLLVMGSILRIIMHIKNRVTNLNIWQ